MRAMQEPTDQAEPGRLARSRPGGARSPCSASPLCWSRSGERGDADEVATTAAAPAVQEVAELPDGVLPFSVAEELGTVDDIDWGERCDTEEGVLAMPLTPPPECFAPYDGRPAARPTTGVTDDTVQVVVYTSRRTTRC